MAASDPSLAYTLPFQLIKTLHREPYEYISPTKKENSQRGRIIVITGGGSGIGAVCGLLQDLESTNSDITQAAAKVWVRAGAEGVVIAARRLQQLEETAVAWRALSKDTKILVVQTDIAVEKDVESLFKQVRDTFGRPADAVLANAGIMSDMADAGEDPVDNWWKSYEINVKGLYTIIHHFIRDQPNSKRPLGTIITVSSGLEDMIAPGRSSYSISKLAGHHLAEFVDAGKWSLPVKYFNSILMSSGLEYATLRLFTVIPGIVMTDMLKAGSAVVAKDHVELVGMLSLWLAQSKADFLRGQLVSVNWDVEEMEAHKHEILGKKLLQMKWIPILPCSGGQGLVP